MFLQKFHYIVIPKRRSPKFIDELASNDNNALNYSVLLWY
jgi:hypothetical protein